MIAAPVGPGRIDRFRVQAMRQHIARVIRHGHEEAIDWLVTIGPIQDCQADAGKDGSFRGSCIELETTSRPCAGPAGAAGRFPPPVPGRATCSPCPYTSGSCRARAGVRR